MATPTPIPAGALACDTNTKLTLASAKALAAAGVVAVCRYAPLPGNNPAGDIDAAELAALTGEGITVWIVQHPRRPELNLVSATTGSKDAATALAHCEAIGYQTPATVCLDVEGVQAGSDAPGYAKAWTQAVLAAGYRVCIYVGFCPRLAAADLAALAAMGDVEFWSDFEALSAHPTPPQGWAGHQQPQGKLAGIDVDKDTILRGSVIVGMGPDVVVQTTDPADAIPIPTTAHRDSSPPDAA